MARLSMNEMTTYRWSFEKDVAECVAAGIPALGVWRQKLSDFGEERGVELLADSGLQASNLLWAGGFTGSDGRSLREAVADAFEAIRLAADMRASTLVVYSGARAGHTHSHARRIVKDALTQLLPLAEELNVTLAIKPVHPECASGWTFLTCLDETVALVESIASAHLKIVFDTYHQGWDAQVVERVARLAPHIAIVHLGDGKPPVDREDNRSRLGEGQIPLTEIFTALSEAGYDGDYDVSLNGPEIENSDYRELLRQSKQAFEQLLAGTRLAGA
jgi:sugar phosphate isomerase/epimerase